MKKIYPVIHHYNDLLTQKQADIAFECGADGVFIISHYGDDHGVIQSAWHTHVRYPDKDVGVNLLSTKVEEVASKVNSSSCINMVWYDNVGIHSDPSYEDTELTDLISKQYSITGKTVFAGVAFKYQQEDENPHVSAYECSRHYGFIPTTSGQGTGKAPALDKIIGMHACSGDWLAIASGMTCENIEEFAPYLSHILVSTGISKNELEFDYGLLRTFIGKVRSLV